MQIFERKSDLGQAPALPGVSPLLARLLAARGVTDAAEAEAFLHPDLCGLHDPYLFTDMDKAVSRLRAALERGERICIFGDYDVDGVCAVSMLLLCLRKRGANVCYHIPSRHEEGYGMSVAAVEALAEQGVALIVTVDNGIAARAEAERCYALGMELIVTDHHLCGESLPRAEAILCHTRPGDTYPNGNICGAGTAYKLIAALLGEEEAREYLPFAGIATIADVVPLLGENRIFAWAAIERLNRGECAVGLKALIAELGPAHTLGARDVGFGIAPRLNAAGRLEDASLCVELLCGAEEETARKTAAALSALNARRQQEEAAICAEAFAILDASDLTETHAIVLRGDWNSGVIGIAASRIAERYYRPVMLFSTRGELYTGSARSIPGVHLYAALLQCAGLLARFGGHAAAAGATLAPEKYDAFCAAFETAVRFVAEDALFVPRRFYEADAELEEADAALAADIERLSPFGEGNPRPLLRVRGAYLRELKPMGDGSHLRGRLCTARADAPAVLFGMGERWQEILAMDRCDVLFAPALNVWRGSANLQLQIKAVRADGCADPERYLAAHAEKFVDAFSRNILYNKAVLSCCRVSADEWLAEELARHTTGTLTLCFTREGAVRFLQNRSAASAMDVGFFAESEGPCAYHAAVLAPVLSRMRPWRYRRILIYDTPVTPGVLGMLGELAPGAALFVGGGNAAELKTALRFTRETLAPLYKALRGADRRFYNREELADYLARQTHAPQYICRLGTDVMAELGFVREENGVEYVKTGARSLEESETFRALCALQEIQEEETWI